jgi:hypothetical protein
MNGSVLIKYSVKYNPYRNPTPPRGTSIEICWWTYFIIFKYLKMGNLLYLVAVVLVVIWAIGFFGYAAGGIIHVLLVIAIVLFLLKFIRREA